MRGCCGNGARPIGVIQVGLGPIGIRMVKDICTRKGVQITGAIDIDPQKVGRDIADVCGLPAVCFNAFFYTPFALLCISS